MDVCLAPRNLKASLHPFLPTCYPIESEGPKGEEEEEFANPEKLISCLLWSPSLPMAVQRLSIAAHSPN